MHFNQEQLPASSEYFFWVIQKNKYSKKKATGLCSSGKALKANNVGKTLNTVSVGYL